MKRFTTTCSAIALLLAAAAVTGTSADTAAQPSTSGFTTFGVIGDFGMGHYKTGSQAEVRSSAAINKVCAEISCNFTLSVGDNIYVGNVRQGLTDSFEKAYTSPGPFFPSVGNHDNVGPQMDYSKLPNSRWRFDNVNFQYTLPIGETGYTVQIFSVNTMDPGLNGGPQKVWLEAELKKSTSRWKFIFGHFPTVGSGRHRRTGTVGSIHTLMEKYNVQAYFAGHDHILEVSNMGGRVLPISGAMARGGMMLRGIGGQFRRFTLTQPGEFNANAQDWPGHGFITGQLSPNVMTLTFWDHYGGAMYELSTTWDWLTKVKHEASAAANTWPDKKVILAAYKDELKLPRGPGGGVSIWPDRTVHPLPSHGGAASAASSNDSTAATTTPAATTSASSSSNHSNTTGSSNRTQHNASTTAKGSTTHAPATTTAGPPTTTVATNATLPPVTLAPELHKVTIQPAVRDDTNIPTATRYSVATECDTCGANIYAGVPFVLYVSGVDVTSHMRIFLTDSVMGCDLAHDDTHARRVAGTELVHANSNTIPFMINASAPSVYVCLSANDGSDYTRLSRGDTPVPEDGFVVLSDGAPRTGDNNNAVIPTQAATPAPSGASTPTPSQAYATTVPTTADAGGGHSLATVLFVGVACAVVGYVLSETYKRHQADEAQSQQLRAAHEAAERGGPKRRKKRYGDDDSDAEAPEDAGTKQEMQQQRAERQGLVQDAAAAADDGDDVR